MVKDPMFSCDLAVIYVTETVEKVGCLRCREHIPCVEFKHLDLAHFWIKGLGG